VSTLEIINNDSDVAVLTTTSLKMVKKAFSYDERFSNKAELFETIHGHIIKFKCKEGSYFDWCEGMTRRLYKEDLEFFSSLVGFRWVEVTHDLISIGFTNTPDKG